MITLEELYKKAEEAKILEKEANKLKRKARKREKEDKAQESVAIENNNQSGEFQSMIERIEEESPEEMRRDKLDSWKPYEIKDFVLPEFKIPVRKSNNYESSKREQLSKILTFIDFVQRKRTKSGCTVMPIPTTSRQNLLIWEHEKAVSRAIQFMKEIGLISTYDGTYRYGVPYKGGNYGKLYAYYKDNEDKLIQYCKDNNIQKYRISNVEKPLTEKLIKKIEATSEEMPYELSKVRFGRNLNLKKPAGLSMSEFKSFLTFCLYENYPDLKFHQSKVDEINEKFYRDYPKLQLRFQPHFTWKGNTVTKIGIRLANKLCCTEKADRDNIRNEYGFNLVKDIKSSILRLTLSINSGSWVDESVDIYERINNAFDPNSEFTEERRKAIKQYSLIAYFEDGTEKMLGKNVTYKLGKTGFVKTEVDELMGRLRNAMHTVIGKFYGSDIFYIESCVYLMTVYDLLTSGHLVWLLYDEFHACGEIDQETFEEMIQNGVKFNFMYFMDISNFGKELKKKEA